MVSLPNSTANIYLSDMMCVDKGKPVICQELVMLG